METLFLVYSVLNLLLQPLFAPRCDLQLGIDDVDEFRLEGSSSYQESQDAWLTCQFLAVFGSY